MATARRNAILHTLAQWGLGLARCWQVYENSLLTAKNIGGDPVHHRSKSRKTPMYDNELPLSDDQTRFVFERGWK